MANLVTLEEYKTYKKMTKTDDDNVLNFIISSVSDLVKTYCGHSFIDYFAQDKVELITVRGDTQESIQLTEWPVISVSSVEYRDSYENDYETTDRYYLDEISDSLFINGGYWPKGNGAVKVTYRGGSATTPDDVKLATLDLVAHYFKEEYKEQKSIGNAIINTGGQLSNNNKWPTHVVRILDFHRNG